MTIESNDAIPKDLKANKANRTDEHREQIQCGCKKAGQCHREAHVAGMSCEQIVTLSKSNRHKVCNQCRKTKAKKSGEVHSVGASSLASQNREHATRASPNTIINGDSVLDPSFLSVPLPNDIPSAIPQMQIGVGEVIRHFDLAGSVNIPTTGNRERNTSSVQSGRQQCQCDKGGMCSRAKHDEGQPCDRVVCITKTDKHTRCKGCRYLKKRKTVGVAGASNQISSMSMAQVEVPVPMAQPTLLNMSQHIAVPHSMPTGIPMSLADAY